MSTLFTFPLDSKRKKAYEKLSVFADNFVICGGTGDNVAVISL